MGASSRLPRCQTSSGLWRVKSRNPRRDLDVTLSTCYSYTERPRSDQRDETRGWVNTHRPCKSALRQPVMDRGRPLWPRKCEVGFICAWVPTRWDLVVQARSNREEEATQKLLDRVLGVVG